MGGLRAPVDRSLLVGRPEEVAPALLGTLLVSGPGAAAGRSGEEAGLVTVRVDEVEAYAGPGEDPGSHAHRGLRPRNRTMFSEPGHLYVYFTYGMHWCVNVVAHLPGEAGAVLLRAGEVVGGEAAARTRRPPGSTARDLARGPARLAQALGLDGRHDGADLCDPTSPVRLLPGQRPPDPAHGPRVGVAGDGAATPWRWWDASSRHVSAYRAAARRRRPGETPGAGAHADAPDPQDDPAGGHP
ncbi:DNA-3-methyladenine glycosylase [Aquipuribacter sp. SD81]|uniref:DNA-3-methyladenine glycosylase n=1 Tax=Aquipuribacter sp. SD81 TaxID=3127703 RepID=UPI0030189F8E